MKKKIYLSNLVDRLSVFAKYSLFWILHFLKGFFRFKRFILITHPYFRKQILFDNHSRKFLYFVSRDLIDWTQIEHIFLNQEFDLSPTNRKNLVKAEYQRIIREGKTPLILDCGSNIGLASKYFKYEYPECRVIGIEPEINNFEQALLSDPNNQLLFKHAAISSSAGSGSIVNNSANSNSFRVEKNLDSSSDINFITINQIIEENKDCVPFIMKIDIEGFEDDLFSANTEWIDKFMVIYTELHDWMLPNKYPSNNFLSVISSKKRNFMHFDGYVVSIR
jgi:FkbM family methyltransferase